MGLQSLSHTMAIAVSSGGGIADTNDAASRSRRLMAWMYLAARSLKRARRHRCLCLISLCRRRPAFCPARTARTAGVRRQARTPRPTQPSPCPARCADARGRLARTARFPPHPPPVPSAGCARGSGSFGPSLPRSLRWLRKVGRGRSVERITLPNLREIEEGGRTELPQWTTFEDVRRR